MLFDLLLLLLVELHDLHPLSLHQTTLFDVELFLRLRTDGWGRDPLSIPAEHHLQNDGGEAHWRVYLCVDLLHLLAGLLLDEAHHVLDLYRVVFYQSQNCDFTLGKTCYYKCFSY